MHQCCHSSAPLTLTALRHTTASPTSVEPARSLRCGAYHATETARPLASSRTRCWKAEGVSFLMAKAERWNGLGASATARPTCSTTSAMKPTCSLPLLRHTLSRAPLPSALASRHTPRLGAAPSNTLKLDS